MSNRICQFAIMVIAVALLLTSAVRGDDGEFRADPATKAWPQASGAASPPFPAPAAEEVSLTFRSGALWSDCNDVAVAGDFAYVTMRHGLSIFDISDPTAPTLVSEVYFKEGCANDVTVDGHYVYVTARGPGDYTNSGLSAMYVVDVSDRSAPFIAGRWSPPSTAAGVCVRDGLAYVDYGHVRGEMGLVVLDVADPGHIDLVGKLVLDLVNSPYRVAVSGNAAFIAGMADLHVADISDPANPTLIAEVLSRSYWPCDLDVSGDGATLYLAYRDSFWPSSISAAAIFDIADPSHPTEIGQLDLGVRVLDVDVEGDLMFVCNSTCGLKVADISDPAQPELVGTYRVPGVALKAAVRDGLVYLVDAGRLTTSDAEAGSCWTPVNPEGPYDGDFMIIDATTPSEPTLKGFYSVPGPVTGVAVRNDLLLGLNECHADSSHPPGADVSILDISNRNKPRVLSTYKTPGTGMDAVFVSDSIVLLAAGSQGMDVLDLSDPYNPVCLTNYPVTGDVVDLCSVGDYVFLAASQGGVHIADISEVTSPDSLATIDIDRPVIFLDVQWPYLYAAAPSRLSDARFCVFDVSDPRQPVEVYRLEGNGFSEVYAEGDRLYAAFRSGFIIFDITDPTAPQRLGSYVNTSFCSGIAVAGKHVFATSARGSVEVIDVSDPSAMQFAGLYDTPGHSYTPVIDGPYIYVPDNYGLLILEFDMITDVPDEPEPDVPGDFVLHQNYPNPFNSGTVISFELSRRAQTKLSVYDLLGRRVTTLVDGWMSAGRHRAIWEGTNAANEPVASGLYLYRLEVDDKQTSKKMMLVQ